jgi:predicted MFS family arabinose efflux permease
MMFLPHVLIALGIALVLTIMLSVIVIGWRHPNQSGLWPFIMITFVVLFFAIWAGGIWLSPIKSNIWGAFWMPFFIVGILVSLLIIAFTPRRQIPKARNDDEEEGRISQTENIAKGAVGVLILLLVVFIIAHYAS